MRVQQLENGIFIKSLDNIDSYLVNMMNRYFNSDNDDIRINIENIINEAIRRVKSEIDYIIKDSVIKISVTSVNKMNGDVILDYSSVGAERAFDKSTAFNKDFGNVVGTICAGDDIRLSDPREPLEHQHINYLTPLDLEATLLSLLAKNGITINNNDIIISNKNLEISNGELIEKNVQD